MVFGFLFWFWFLFSFPLPLSFHFPSIYLLLLSRPSFLSWLEPSTINSKNLDKKKKSKFTTWSIFLSFPPLSSFFFPLLFFQLISSFFFLLSSFFFLSYLLSSFSLTFFLLSLLPSFFTPIIISGQKICRRHEGSYGFLLCSRFSQYQ